MGRERGRGVGGGRRQEEGAPTRSRAHYRPGQNVCQAVSTRVSSCSAPPGPRPAPWPRARRSWQCTRGSTSYRKVRSTFKQNSLVSNGALQCRTELKELSQRRRRRRGSSLMSSRALWCSNEALWCQNGASCLGHTARDGGELGLEAVHVVAAVAPVAQDDLLVVVASN